MAALRQGRRRRHRQVRHRCHQRRRGLELPLDRSTSLREKGGSAALCLTVASAQEDQREGYERKHSSYSSNAECCRIGAAVRKHGASAKPVVRRRQRGADGGEGELPCRIDLRLQGQQLEGVRRLPGQPEFRDRGHVSRRRKNFGTRGSGYRERGNLELGGGGAGDSAARRRSVLFVWQGRPDVYQTEIQCLRSWYYEHRCPRWIRGELGRR